MHAGRKTIRQPRQPLLLARAQLGAQLEDEVALGQSTERVEREQQVGSHATGAGAQLEDLAARRRAAARRSGAPARR